MSINAVSPAAYQYNVQTVSNNNAFNPYSAVVADDSNTGGTFGGFSTDFTSISSMASHAAGGGFAGYKLGAQMNADMKSIFGNGFKGALGGVKNTAITGLKGAGLSALVSAGVSAVANGVGVATGKVDSSQAVTNVVKDGIGGAVGGLTGVTAAGLASFIPVKGVMGTILTVGAGAVGGVIGGRLASKLTEGF
jgi:hypothetical protein